MISGIAEYINVDYDKDYLIRKHNEARGIEGRDYIECGTESHILRDNPDYYRKWEHILTIMSEVHIGMCEYGTGFNLNGTLTAGVPPHIDFDKREGNQFNLLLPMFFNKDGNPNLYGYLFNSILFGILFLVLLLFFSIRIF